MFSFSPRRSGSLLFLALGLLTAGLARAAAGAPADDRVRLLEGVRSVAAPGLPGSLAVYGKEAFPVVVGRSNGATVAVIAVGRLGSGRVAALAHDGYFREDALKVADTGKLLRNLVTWAAGKTPARVDVSGAPALVTLLQANGFDAHATAPGDDHSGAQVVIVTHQRVETPTAGKLRAFVERGGGLVAASTGWGWAQITGQPITEHPLSAITRGAGIVWTSGTADRTNTEGFDTTAPISPLVHAGEALAALTAKRAPELSAAAQASASVLLAARSAGAADPLLAPGLQSLRQAAGAAGIPTERDPVNNRTPLRRVALALDLEEAQSAAAEAVKAHPAAADFPGAVPADASRVTRRVSVDLSVPGWLSTGLYAAPGEKVTVTRAAGVFPRGLALRIGAHTDELWHLATWKRAPAITRVFALRDDRSAGACAFGGPVYLVVPDGSIGKLELEIAGAVEAPYFQLGKTTVAEWKSLRSRPGPWAELAGEKIIFTVPSSAIRSLENPETLMRLWDGVVRTQEGLAHRRNRERPERIVADRQISAGYMHSGYPIMTPIDDSMVVALDEARLRRDGAWGHFHELGHNLQQPEWTFEGTGEVTNNVLAMYVYPEVLKLPFTVGHPAIREPATRADRLKKYLDAGAPFGKWKDDPFLALTMYIQLVEQFGWTPYRKVFEEYSALSVAQRPKTDQEKRDQWMLRLSRATGRNLGPFFQAWGVPTSDAARQSVQELPAWLPPGLMAR